MTALYLMANHNFNDKQLSSVEKGIFVKFISGGAGYIESKLPSRGGGWTEMFLGEWKILSLFPEAVRQEELN